MSIATTLKLDASIRDNQITMCVYEEDSTLPHYDQTSVSLQEVFSLCGEIVKLLNKANGAIGRSSGISAELKKAGRCLYDQLLTESAKTKFRVTKAANLEVFIDEGLVSIPWELLFDGTQFLCLRFNIGRKVKTRQPSRSSGERTAGFPIKMLILADPTNDLPMARQEAGVIVKQLDAMRKIIAVDKEVMNIDSVFVKKNLREYDIVHYAGHADHDPANPSQSGWKLSGGQLTAEDIAKMGETAPLPSLVFSNACRSAQTEEWVGGDFETEVFGLANAFLCAGVRHYIGTSWKIPDDVSLAFAKEFYAQLSQSKSVGEAIRQARLQIIKEQGEDSIVWASYVLYGDPACVLFAEPAKRVFVIKWPMVQKLMLFLVVLGIAGGVWGIAKILEGGSDKQALGDYYYQESLKAEKEGKTIESRRLLIKASNYYKLSSFKMNLLNKKDSRKFASFYIDVAYVQLRQMFFKDAESSLNLAMNLAKETGFSNVLVPAYTGLMEVAIFDKNWDAFDKNYQSYLSLQKEPRLLRLFYLVFGNKAFEAGNLKLAAKLYLEASRWCKEDNSENVQKQLQFSYESLSRIYFEEQSWDDALFYVKKTREIAFQRKDKVVIRGMFIRQIDVLKQLKDYNGAFEILKQWRLFEIDSGNDHDMLKGIDEEIRRIGG